MEKFVLTPYTKKLSADTETPITIFQKYVGDKIGFLLESREPGKGRYSFIAKNPFAVLKSKGMKTIVEERGKIEILEGKTLDIIKNYISKYEINGSIPVPFVGGAVGTVGYEIIRQYEKLPDFNIDELQLPDVHQMFVKEILAYDHFHQQIIIVVLDDISKEGQKRAEKKIRYIENQLSVKINSNELYPTNDIEIKANMDKEEFIKCVEKAKKYIYEGDIFQVVLSQRWTVHTDQKSFELYRKLRQVNPSSYLFYINFGEYQVAGSSPEMLVELRKDKINTCPIAGTRKRGKNEKEDKLLAHELLTDEKEQAEHVMLVDLGRNDMGRVAKIGSVEVERFMEVENYSHVMHLVSLVSGIKNENDDMFSVLSTFLPAGTLSGAPKIRAMEIIEELETSKRGIYGGAVGYFGFDGDMDMCIAIRTMVINDGKVYMQAGAGIVADSDPEREYEETVNKVSALIKALK